MLRRFFIHPSEINKPSPIIKGQDALHIRKVLRLQVNDHIILFDGSENEYVAAITAILKDHVQVEIIQKYISQNESPIQIIVMQGFLKDKKMDQLIRGLTEIGVSAWMPVFSGYSIPRPDEHRISSRVHRWQEIAKESLKQCRRSVPMEIRSPLPFHQAVCLEKHADLKILFWENETRLLRKTVISEGQKLSKIVIMIGPEGGFSIEEVDMAKAENFISVSLGPRTLKAETATLAACILIQYLYGDMA